MLFGTRTLGNEGFFGFFRDHGVTSETLTGTGVDFVNLPIDTAAEPADLRASGKPHFDQMPLLELDGHHPSQSSATIRYLARRGGLYGANDTEAMWADMIAGVVAAFAETVMQVAFRPSVEIATAELEARFAKFSPRFEVIIVTQGSGSCVADQMTFADVVLA